MSRKSAFGSQLGKKFFAIFCIAALLPLLLILGFVYYYTKSYLIEENSDLLQKESKLLNLVILEKLHFALDTAKYSIDQKENSPNFSRIFESQLQLPFKDSNINSKARLTTRGDGRVSITLVSIEEQTEHQFTIKDKYLWEDLSVLSPEYSYCLNSIKNNIAIYCSDKQQPANVTLPLQNYSTSMRNLSNDSELLVYARPFGFGDRFEDATWQASVGVSKDSILGPANFFQQLFGLFFLLTLLLVVLVSRRLIIKVLSPLRKLTSASLSISQDGHAEPIKTNSSHDEFDDLVLSFNQMSQSLDNQFKNLSLQNELDKKILANKGFDPILKHASRSMVACSSLEWVACAVRLSAGEDYSLCICHRSGDQIQDTLEKLSISSGAKNDLESIGILKVDLARILRLSDNLDQLISQSDLSKINFLPIETMEFDLGFILSCSEAQSSKRANEIGVLQSYSERLKIAWNHRKSLLLLEKQANYDFLTGLPNRKYLLDHLNDRLAKEKELETTFIVFYIDLDNFKQVNDSLGHKVGDELLKVVSKRLSSLAIADEIVARQGGDEFIFIKNVAPRHESEIDLAQQITREFSAPIKLSGHHINVSMSLGIAVYPEDGRDIDTLLMNADTALYKAKQAGKSSFLRYEKSMNATALSRLELEADLWNSITKDQLFFLYQPVIDYKNQRIGFEALIRWQNPNRGICSPDFFIPLAEETGFILEISNWMFDIIFKDTLKLHRLLGERFSKVAINLSATQLSVPNFAETLIQTVSNNKLAPELVELELTENVYFDHFSDTRSVLKKLRQAGFSISLDDFGTGYSSLSYVQQLPFNRLKVDRSFVRDIGPTDPISPLLETILNMASILSLEVTVEGVETIHQLELIKSKMECSIQGFLLSKPIEIEECVAFGSTFKFDE